MFHRVLSIVESALAHSYVNVRGLTFFSTPTNLEKEIYTPSNKIEAPLVPIKIQEENFMMDSLIFEHCFLNKPEGVTAQEFSDFQKVLYGHYTDIFSPLTVLHYIRVAKKMNAEDGLFHTFSVRIEGKKSRDSFMILSEIHHLFTDISEYKDQDFVRSQIEKLPRFPGHHPLYKNQLVKDMYSSRLKYARESEKIYLTEYLTHYL